ncbi:MAG: beta-ketoacyl synthase N-terminal-like domain-containing protein [Kineosporiaceae bacterium]
MSAVVVTGTGATCAAGADVARIWQAMGRAGTRPRPADDPDARMARPLIYPAPDPAVPFGAAPEDGAPGGAVPEDTVPEARAPGPAMPEDPVPGRTTALLLTAAAEALATAGLPAGASSRPAPGRLGVVVGTGMGESGAHERRRSGQVPVAPAAHRAVFAVAGDLARSLDARGPVVSVSNACAASAYALGEAVELLRSGECDVVLACGAESYSRVALACFNRMGAVDAERCRPFAAERGGTVFGEGAAVLVLETAEHAAARGASALARVLGTGFSCDADHPTAPSADGAQAARALREALADGGVDPGEVVAVVPHGTGTEHNDLVEARVLADVFGPRAAALPLYSLKALIGHTGGAAGALAAVAAVELLRHRRMPANPDVGRLDPDLVVDLPSTERALPPGPVVVNAYAFGGNNASVVLAGAA